MDFRRFFCEVAKVTHEAAEPAEMLWPPEFPLVLYLQRLHN